MRIIMLATGPFAVPTLRALAAEETIAQVVCRPPRGRRDEPAAPVRLAAEELGLPLWMPESVNLPESQQRLRELDADLLVVCDYGEILKDETLRTTRLGGINLHGSLLPKYRGAAPVQWAVINGDERTGNTVIHMTPGLDAGPVLGQQSTPIKPDETAGELEYRLADMGPRLVLEVVEQLAAGTARGEPQDKSQRTKAPRLAKSDGRIDWSQSALAIKNRVRGLQPWPRTFTFYEQKGQPQRLVVDKVQVAEGRSGAKPGEVLLADSQLTIATGSDDSGQDGALELLEVQPAGKRRMAAAEWLRGSKIAVGDNLAPGQ